MKSKKGAILITTLWILSLLTLLAVGIGTRMGVDIKLIGFSLNSLKAHYIAKAGVLRAITLIEDDHDTLLDYLKETWATGYDFGEEEYLLKGIEIGEGFFTVGYKFGESLEGKAIDLYGSSDEESRININKAGTDVLSLLPGVTTEIAASIIDWRDEDSIETDYFGSRGAEDKYYKEELENPYDCKNAPFSVPEELTLVKGMTWDIYDGLKDLITVYGEDDKVNINTVSLEMLNVLLGQEGFEERPLKILNVRSGFDDVPGTEDDDIIRDIKGFAFKYELTESQMKYFKMSTNTFRIKSTGMLKSSKVKKTIEVVVARKKNEGITPLYYYED